VFGLACTKISNLKFKILLSFHSGYLSVFPHNKRTNLYFVSKFSHDDTQVMKYTNSFMIRRRYNYLREPLSRMYISHRVTQAFVRPYRNNCILKYIFIFLMQEKYQMLPTQTKFSKTYSAAAITFSTSEPKKKLNHGRMPRRDKLVLRKAVSYEKYHSTKQRTFCSSVAVTV